MRCQLRTSAVALLLATVSLPAVAQRTLTIADSALVTRILAAEDKRDSASPAFAAGLAHADSRIQVIARRARTRVADPKFAARDSLPALPAPPVYSDPAWRLRYRVLTQNAVNCGVLAYALADSAWPVRLRAADLVSTECAGDSLIRRALRAWVASPPRSNTRVRGGTAWQPAGHALVALARIAPAEARNALPSIASSPIPWLRMYAARAAGRLSDTVRLRDLARDANDNVKEAAIDALAKLAGHSADDVYLQALSARGSHGYQVIRSAAIALKGTERREATTAVLRSALAPLRADSSETSRDARTALADRLRELGDASASAELIASPPPVPLSANAVELALGKDVRLRVTLADSSGGGSFIVRLRGDVAPIMAARILALARAGWYNGRTWYRVEPDFVIQGGGPGSNEYVGHPRFMRDELGTLKHPRGTVGMSTRGHDTGDAQWFVNLRDNQRLTGDYTVFGEIIDGIDVVDGILEGDVIARIEVVSSSAPRR